MTKSPDLQSRLEKLTPSQRELLLQHLRQQSTQPSAIPRTDAEPVLSYAQQRLLFLDQLSNGGSTYNICGGVKIRGHVSVDLLDRSLSAILSRHDTLRTRFPEGRVVVEPPPAGSVLQVRQGKHEDLSAAIHREFQHVFSLSQGPLYRFVLLPLTPTEHLFLISLHHIVADGWSLGVLIREAGQIYAAFATNNASPLPPLSIQYVDFSAWQRKHLQGPALDKHIEFWKSELAGAPQIVNLPTDFPRGATQSFDGATYTAIFPSALAARIASLSASRGATPFMTLFAAFSVFLARYSGQRDLLVGSPVANRTRTETESLIGLFVNTLVLRTNLSDNPTFDQCLQRVQETVRRAFAHQELPFDLLVDALRPDRNLSLSPLVQVMFAFQNAHAVAGGAAWAHTPGGELTLSPIADQQPFAKFDLTLFLEEQPSGLTATWEYATSLFEPATIQRMHRNFLCLLWGIVEKPETAVAQLPLVPADELHQLLYGWSATAAEYPRDLTLPRWFERQVKRTPEAVAVQSGPHSLTYAELNARSNQLARLLRSRGVGSEDVVGLLCSRSLDLMIGVLAILKAGAAYVPLDPSYPAPRLRMMLEDARAALVLTQTALAASVPDAATRFCLDTGSALLDAHSSANLDESPGPEQLAYILYTSGSTGVPKGVEVLHRGLINYLWWARSAYKVEEGTGAPVLSSISFDATITAWLLPLLAGRVVTLLPEGEELESLRALLHSDANYSLLKITPAHLEAVSHLVQPRDFVHAARTFVIGGEALLTRQIEYWQRHAPGLRLINEYGPTETVVGCCVYEVPPSGAGRESVPIGRPIANTVLYVLDDHGQPVPIGVPGELYIGGSGVARGYRNRPELTAERFLPNPFGPGKIYRTGDLVKYLADGNLLFLGRLDDQVKIRGFRVELGEVEAVFVRHPAVRESAIVADVQRLLAYLVPAAAAATRPSNQELRAFAGEHLPEYMVPSRFVWIDAMPLTPNGKLDRRALPSPVSQEERTYTAPRTAAEKTMVQLWAEILELPQVGVDDNFFDLGGHSLLAMQLISRVRQDFGVELPLRRLFEAPTPAQLTTILVGLQAPASPTIRRVSREQHRRSTK